MCRILRSAVSWFVVSISLVTCTSATHTGSQPSSEPSSEPAGVTLFLVATHASNGCCRVFTMNPGRADSTVVCSLVALDPAGRLIFTAVIPPKAPGHLRSSAWGTRTRSDNPAEGRWLSIARHDRIAAMLASLLYVVLRRLLT
ncbi:MAG: hypothetical protein M3P18_15235, partial [Actinomycetota bacterium]|nr:hypothetical protein [Actinomycetota bacterium]